MESLETTTQRIRNIVSRLDLFEEITYFLKQTKINHKTHPFDEKYQESIDIVLLSLIFKYSKRHGEKPDINLMNELKQLGDDYVTLCMTTMIDNHKEDDDLGKIMSIYFRSQQWATSRGTCVRDSFRMYYIMKHVHNSVAPSNQLDFESATLSKNSCSLIELFLVSIALILFPEQENYFFTKQNISDYKKSLGLDLLTTITSRQIDINDSKQVSSISSWHQIRINPFIKIGDIYSILSIPAIYDMISTLLYWSARDFYNNKNYDNEYFPRKFGYYFEEYVNELCDYYFHNNYKHYDPNLDDLTKPDFRIETDKYLIYIEVKSYISKISTWDYTNNSSFKDLTKFVDKLNSKSIKQLRSQPSINGKIRINFAVCLDYMEVSSIFESKIHLDGKEPIYYINISELEQLFELLSIGSKKFDKIMKEKKRRYLSTNIAENCSFAVLIYEIIKSKRVDSRFLKQKLHDCTPEFLNFAASIHGNKVKNEFLKLVKKII